MKPTLHPFLLAPVMAILASTAHAQTADPAPPAASTSEANAALASQYIARGTWQSLRKQDGLSIGSWSSNIGGKMSDAGTSGVDLYGGYSGSVSDIGYSAIVYYYVYPGAKTSAVNVKYDYGEVSLGVNYKIFSARYNHSYTKDYFGFGDARGSGYLDVGASFDVGAGFGLQLHYGLGRVRNWPDYDWRDYKIALTRSFSNGWMAMAAVTKGSGMAGVVDTAPSIAPSEVSQALKTNAVISVTKSF